MSDTFPPTISDIRRPAPQERTITFRLRMSVTARSRRSIHSTDLCRGSFRRILRLQSHMISPDGRARWLENKSRSATNAMLNGNSHQPRTIRLSTQPGMASATTSEGLQSALSMKRGMSRKHGVRVIWA